MKEFWSDKYVGKKWFFDAEGYEGDKMCLLLVLEILKNEAGFDISKKSHQEIKDAGKTWYDVAPTQLVLAAHKYGKTITKIEELKEFDIAFFKLEDNVVRHCGIMIDNYGKFLHQLKDTPTRIDRIQHKHWQDTFFCAIRVVEK